MLHVEIARFTPPKFWRARLCSSSAKILADPLQNTAEILIRKNPMGRHYPTTLSLGARTFLPASKLMDTGQPHPTLPLFTKEPFLPTDIQVF